ncbi:MAG: polysaccharide deacetylase family protein [bacterium]
MFFNKFFKYFLLLLTIVIFSASFFLTSQSQESNNSQINPDIINPKLSLNKITVLANYKKPQVLGVETEIKNFKDIYVPTLMYHYIRDYNDPKDPVGIGLSVSPTNFDKQMNQLKSMGYTPIIFQDILNYIQKDYKLPANPIIISFDDGYEDHYSVAFPILKKYGFLGVFAVITGNVGKPNYMNWDQILEMKKAGNEIASHTVSHPNLANISSQKLTQELENSKQTLDSTLGQNTQVIIYPSGGYNQSVMQAAKTAGYRIGRTTKYGTVISQSNIMELPTVRMTNSSGIPKIVNNNFPAEKNKKKAAYSGSISCPQYSNLKTISLNIAITDNVFLSSQLKMKISNDELFTNKHYENYSVSKTWNLDGGAGIKKVYVQFINPNEEISPVYSCSITLDTVSPVLNDLSYTGNEDNVVINWATSENTINEVEYGVSNMLDSKGKAFDDNLLHSIIIEKLLPCTEYFFRIKAVDLSQNISYSESFSIITKGCIGSAPVLTNTSQYVKNEDGGIVKLSSELGGVQLEIPKNSFTKNLTYKINKLQKESVIHTIGQPKTFDVIGNHVYDIKSLENSFDTVTKFNQPEKIQIQYSKNEIDGYDMATLAIFGWKDNNWAKLDNCTNDNNSVIKCDTNYLSIFELAAKKSTKNTLASNVFSDVNNLIYLLAIIVTIIFVILYMKYKKRLSKYCT